MLGEGTGTDWRLQNSIWLGAAGKHRVRDAGCFRGGFNLSELGFRREQFVAGEQRVLRGGVAEFRAARHVDANVARGGDAVARDRQFARRALDRPPRVAKQGGDVESA
jgi:hypothetical protein